MNITKALVKLNYKLNLFLKGESFTRDGSFDSEFDVRMIKNTGRHELVIIFLMILNGLTTRDSLVEMTLIILLIIALFWSLIRISSLFVGFYDYLLLFNVVAIVCFFTGLLGLALTDERVGFNVFIYLIMAWSVPLLALLETIFIYFSKKKVHLVGSYGSEGFISFLFKRDYFRLLEVANYRLDDFIRKNTEYSSNTTLFNKMKSVSGLISVSGEIESLLDVSLKAIPFYLVHTRNEIDRLVRLIIDANVLVDKGDLTLEEYKTALEKLRDLILKEVDSILPAPECPDLFTAEDSSRDNSSDLTAAKERLFKVIDLT